MAEKLKTTNKVPNKKIITSTIGGGVGGGISVYLYPILTEIAAKSLSGWSAEFQLAVVGLIIIGITAGAAFVSGYYTSPGANDGIVPK